MPEELPIYPLDIPPRRPPLRSDILQGDAWEVRNPTALVIQRDEFDVLGILLQRYFKGALQVTSVIAPTIEVHRIDEIVKSKYGCIVLPLSLSNYGSLRIAELVHGTQMPTQLILRSGTQAPREILVPLFDDFISIPESYEDVLRSMSQPIAPRLPKKVVREMILNVIEAAGCFERFKQFKGYSQVWAEPR